MATAYFYHLLIAVELLVHLGHSQNVPIYDFIIVGSGSAGSVIANRLSEIPEWNILLLEAGKQAGFSAELPPLFVPILQNTTFDWSYLMEYDPGFARGMNNHRCAWPRGKALGGTSVINYMIYTRGNPGDFNRWEQQGNLGWSYKKVLPYYLKSERAKLRRGNPAYHNTNGYLSVEDSHQSPLVKAFIKGGQELGYQNVDYSSPHQIGFSTIQATTKNGRRQSVAKAFLESISRRQNLRIYTSAHVTRILIDHSTKKAYGVEYLKWGKINRVYAKKEVIISAGAISSPQLLMLSGIGPQEHLEQLDIPVVQNLRVGENLQDHVALVALMFTVNQSNSYSIDKLTSPKTVREWLLFGKGPYTSLGGVEGIGYIHTNVSTDEKDFPDMELLFVGGSINADLGLANYRSMNIRTEVYNKFWKPLENHPTWTIFPVGLHPKSKGYLKLRTKHPLDYPLLVGNYFSDPKREDIKTFIAGIRFIIRLSQTLPFQQFGTKLYNLPIPGCENFMFNSDPYWECAVRTLSISLHHQVGTCKMGPPHDSEAVVNHKLKVYGIENLRVADTSIIPMATSAHTNAPSIMVGEKAADLIKETWNKL